MSRSLDPGLENVRLDDVVVNEYLTVKGYCSGHIGSFKDAATDMVSYTTVLINTTAVKMAWYTVYRIQNNHYGR